MISDPGAPHFGSSVYHLLAMMAKSEDHKMGDPQPEISSGHQVRIPLHV